MPTETIPLNGLMFKRKTSVRIKAMTILTAIKAINVASIILKEVKITEAILKSSKENMWIDIK